MVGARALLVLVAKYPSPGSVKTRLHPVLTASEAAEFSRACLEDLLLRLHAELPCDESLSFQKVWFFSPTSSKPHSLALLSSLGLNLPPPATPPPPPPLPTASPIALSTVANLESTFTTAAQGPAKTQPPSFSRPEPDLDMLRASRNILSLGRPESIPINGLQGDREEDHVDTDHRQATHEPGPEMVKPKPVGRDLGSGSFSRGKAQNSGEAQQMQLGQKSTKSILRSPVGIGGRVAAACMGWDLLAQPEGDLGARLLEAARAAESFGTRCVVLIGQDTPDLPTAEIVTAAQSALAGVPYMCPSTDGGYVLLSLPVPCPDAVFDNIEWSTRRTANQQLRQIAACSLPDVALGPTYQDVDEPTDLFALACRCKNPAVASLCPRTSAFLSAHVSTGTSARIGL